MAGEQDEMARLESQVLDQYKRMAVSLDRFANVAQDLSQAQPILLEHMRPLERKMGLVVTLFKGSVWSVIVQKQAQ